MSSLKVLVVNPNFYRSSGVTVAIKRIHYSSPSDVTWRFVSCDYGDDRNGDDEEWCAAVGVWRCRLMSANPLRFLAAMLQIVVFIREDGIDIVHVHHRRLILVFWLVRLFVAIKIVYTGQLTYAPTKALRPFHIDIGVGISDAVIADMRASVAARRFVRIGNPAIFSKQKCELSEHRVESFALCVARLAPVKNHVFLLRGWRNLLDRGLKRKLLLVGEGPLQAELRSLVAKLELRSWVEFVGYCSDVPSLLEKCAFGVLTSLVEGNPVAVLEAAAHGRATLVSDVDGNRDAIPPDVELPNRVVLGNPEELGAILYDWFSAPKAVSRDGHRFYDFHRKRSSSTAVATAYGGLYRRLAAIESLDSVI